MSVEGLSVSWAFRHIGISWQAHYQGQCHRVRDEAKHERTLELARGERWRRQPRLGTRKLHHLLEPKLVAEG